MTIKQWPDNNGRVPFWEITGPICDSIRAAYKLERINEDKDVLYNGLDIGKDIPDLRPDQKLTAENLRYDKEDQGRDALEVLIGIAVQLGSELGKRIEKRQMLDRVAMAAGDCNFYEVIVKRFRDVINGDNLQEEADDE